MSSLKLQTNVPEIIALEYADGLAVESKFGGDQIMYTLVDGRKLYASASLASKIDALALTPGEEFEIVKAERKIGERRIVEFAVNRAGSASEPMPARVDEQSRGQIGNRATASPSYGAALRLVSNGAPLAPPAPVPAVAVAPPADSAAVALLKVAGCGAIDAVLEMERHAQTRGLTDFSFGVDNIQKFAACLFIELAKRGSR